MPLAGSRSPARGRRGCAVDDAVSRSPAGLRVDADQVEAVDGEPVVGPHAREQAHVALALVAEVEVLPDDDEPGGQAVDEDLADEVLGGSLRPGLVEVDHQRVVDAGGLQQLELLLEVGEQEGRRLGPDDHGRVPVEGHDGAVAARARRRPPPHLGDDGLVPEVHAVVGTDGDHAPAGGRGHGPDVVQHLHPPEATSDLAPSHDRRLGRLACRGGARRRREAAGGPTRPRARAPVTPSRARQCEHPAVAHRRDVVAST